MSIFLRHVSRVSRLSLKVMWSSWPNLMRMKRPVTMQRVSAAPLAGNYWWIWRIIDTETRFIADDTTRSCQGNAALDVMRWGTLQWYVLKWLLTMMYKIIVKFKTPQASGNKKLQGSNSEPKISMNKDGWNYSTLLRILNWRLNHNQAFFVFVFCPSVKKMVCLLVLQTDTHPLRTRGS